MGFLDEFLPVLLRSEKSNFWNPTPSMYFIVEVTFHDIHECEIVDGHSPWVGGGKIIAAKERMIILTDERFDLSGELLKYSSPVVIGWSEDKAITDYDKGLLSVEADKLRLEFLGIFFDVLWETLENSEPNMVWGELKRDMPGVGEMKALNEQILGLEFFYLFFGFWSGLNCVVQGSELILHSNIADLI